MRSFVYGIATERFNRRPLDSYVLDCKTVLARKQRLIHCVSKAEPERPAEEDDLLILIDIYRGLKNKFFPS